MNLITKTSTLSFAILFIAMQLYAQVSEKPVVGQPVPDFLLKDVKYYKEKTISPATMKGKWLVLDFWFKRCSSCITSFPKINALRQEFLGSAEFVLVGHNGFGSGRGEEILYEKLVKKKNLNIPVAYDSMLGYRWDVTPMPKIFIIDPNGIVRHITDGRDMTSSKIRDMIEGKPVSFFTSDKFTELFYPYRFGGAAPDTSDHPIYRSILCKWNGQEQNGGIELDRYFEVDKQYRVDGWSA